jgi:tryptophanyl-tRNA synthetase
MSASPELIQEKVRQMVTDPGRIRKTDPGNPKVCTVFQFYKIFAPNEFMDTHDKCVSGSIGCVACKKKLAQIIIERMEPVYRRRMELEKKPSIVEEVLQEGAKRAQRTAAKVLLEVRRAMNV